MVWVLFWSWIMANNGEIGCYISKMILFECLQISCPTLLRIKDGSQKRQIKNAVRDIITHGVDLLWIEDGTLKFHIKASSFFGRWLWTAFLLDHISNSTRLLQVTPFVSRAWKLVAICLFIVLLPGRFGLLCSEYGVKLPMF